MLLDIVNNESGWPEEVVSLAKELYGMNTTYSAYAANFSQKLFINQKKLGLDSAEVIAAIKEVATIIEVIEQNSETAIKIAVSNQPAPELGSLPREDA